MVFLKLVRKDFEVGHAVRRDRECGGGFAVEPPAREHRGMLDRRPIAVPGAARLRGKRQRIRLGAAAGEDHVLGARAGESRHLLARRLDGRARRPALGMNRGRIAVKRQRRGNSVTHFGAKRRGGVIIEIETLVHALTKLAATRRRLTLARAPVARAMKRGPKYAPLQVPSCPGVALFGTILILSCISFRSGRVKFCGGIWRFPFNLRSALATPVPRDVYRGQ